MLDLSRTTLQSHSVDMRQFIDGRQSVLANGMRIIEVYNSSGLRFTILPDRGLDIWTAHYRGVPLTWVSQGSPHPPDYGSPWLRQFNGGLVTTCGLQHVGPAQVDDQTGESRSAHGNYTRLRAEILRSEGRWEGDAYTLELKGRVGEACLFGEQIRLERTYRINLGTPGFELVDLITNLSDVPVPFMLLYHINVGYPLVRQGARLDVPAFVTFPRDEAARHGYESWESYGAPQAGYDEQVFYHHALQSDGVAKVLLSNDDVGLMLEWDTRNAPYLTQWKNLRRGMYVCGIEPGNCVPEGQNTARAAERLVSLRPGEAQTFTTRFQILNGAEGAARGAGEIETLRTHGQPATGFQWEL